MKRGTIMAVVIFLVMGTAAYYINQMPADQLNTESGTAIPTQFMLVGLNEADIQKISINTPNGNVLIGRDADGLWELEQPINPAIDLGTMEMRITDLLNLKAKQVILTDLSDEAIGLDSPTGQIEVTMKDGTTNKYFIGTKNPLDSGYYARNEAGTIVLLNTTSVENVLDLITVSYATPTPTLEPVGTTDGWINVTPNDPQSE